MIEWLRGQLRTLGAMRARRGDGNAAAELPHITRAKPGQRCWFSRHRDVDGNRYEVTLRATGLTENRRTFFCDLWRSGPEPGFRPGAVYADEIKPLSPSNEPVADILPYGQNRVPMEPTKHDIDVLTRFVGHYDL